MALRCWPVTSPVNESFEPTLIFPADLLKRGQETQNFVLVDEFTWIRAREQMSDTMEVYVRHDGSSVPKYGVQ